ncbi:MAG: PepSY domain-containing protein [Gaiellaceae bacterium]
MDKHQRRWLPSRLAVTAAIVAGVAVGSYGIATAASGSGSGSSSAAPSAVAAAPSAQRPWGPQRSDETALTGDALAKVKALALAKVPGGTIVRVETDADGNAAYEAHMVKADGTPATVYVNKQFQVVSVQTGMPGPPARSNGASA